ncbi:hypothetical protein C6503_05755 [Candidatus Poribacteria bacterium]|nr:MAG: hypothetical protein C6503_05755 [Candidatus Poribacteria bacterium]
MTRKVIFLTIVLFFGIGCVSLYFFLTHPQIQQKGFPAIEENRDTRAQQRQSKMGINPAEPYNGPQNVDALLSSFSWIAADPEVDEKYPQREWLQMLFEMGIAIENYDDYSGYMAARRALVELENQPEMWTSDIFGLPPTTDWETFKKAFINRKIWEYEQFRAAMQADPEVDGGFFTGPGKQTFLPTVPGRVYVKRKGRGTVLFGEPLDEAQQTALIYQGIHPEGYEIIYIDDNGQRLTKPPLPLTLENVSETPTYAPQDVPMLTEVSATRDSLKTEEIPVETQQNEEYKPGRHMDDFDQFLESLNDEAFIEFEKFLTEEFPAEFQEYNFSEKQIERALTESFTPERLQYALEVVNRYDPQEGLRRLAEEDPELFELLKKYYNRNGTFQMEATK